MKNDLLKSITKNDLRSKSRHKCYFKIKFSINIRKFLHEIYFVHEIEFFLSTNEYDDQILITQIFETFDKTFNMSFFLTFSKHQKIFICKTFEFEHIVLLKLTSIRLFEYFSCVQNVKLIDIDFRVF